MKLIQKGLLFASIFTIGAGVSVPTIINNPSVVQAATTKELKKITTKKISVKVSKAQLYNQKGKKISRCLTKGTTCKTSEKNTVKGCTYYKVGKNEFVKSSNVRTI
ncbi:MULTISPECIES: SLAP domain-containing protein [unclassified Companilactobacillus]|uniref:SLAP domain-containing protein n=1 Tax=unclassified Companilactobacillus TaxID=2767904 RepID=UPI002FF072A8